MNQACKAFRVEWLGGETGSTHANECPACARWASSSKRVVAALASLERVGVPAELEQRVTLELAGDRSRRLQRVLNSFVRRGAPAALDGRVAELLGGDGVRGEEQRGQRKAEVLRSLDVRPAPDVLERLLNEELAAPERQRVDRFSGTLERMRAPAALAGSDTSFDAARSDASCSALLPLWLRPVWSSGSPCAAVSRIRGAIASRSSRRLRWRGSIRSHGCWRRA